MAQVSGRLLLLNGWRVPVSLSSGDEKAIGAEHGARFQGARGRQRRGLPRDWAFGTTPMLIEDADTLSNLLAGEGHAFPFDDDAFSTRGLGPDSGTYLIQPRTNPAWGGYGTGYLDVTVGSVTWDAELPADRWTVLYWRTVTGTPKHVVVRSDGSRWEDGVQNDALTTPELVVSGGGVALGVGQYDDLVILPFSACASFLEAFWRWTTQMALRIQLGLDDHTDDGLRRTAAATTFTGTYVCGRIGRAGQFTGAQRGTWAGTEVDVFGLTELSVDAWAYRDTGLAAGAIPRIVDKFGTGPSRGYVMFLSGGGVAVSVQTAAGAATTVTGVLTTDVWHHVAFTWTQATGRVDVYVDGRLAAPTLQVIRLGSAASDDTSVDLTVGNNVGGTLALGGRVDEVRVYARALTAKEVADHYSAGKRGQAPPLPLPFSALPSLDAWGALTGFRCVPCVGNTGDEAGETLAVEGTWRNNMSRVSGEIAETSDERRTSLQPMAQWTLDERYHDTPTGTSLRLSHGGFANATKNGTPTFEPGPFGFKRAMLFDSAADFYSLGNGLAQGIASLPAVSVVAWVKRAAIGAQHTVVDFSVSLGLSKLRLDMTATDFLRAVAEPAVAEVQRTFTSTFSVGDTFDWHLVGMACDVANDLLYVFRDDDGYESGAAAFTGVAFSGETSTNHRIGVDVSSLNRFNGRIHSVSVFNRVLSQEDVKTLYRLGRRGVFR